MAASIVQVGKYYPPFAGGIENNVRQLAVGCSSDFGSAVICMQRGRSPARQFADGRVHVFALKSYGAFWRQEISENPASYLDAARPDIVHFHTPNPLLAFPLLAYLRKNEHVKLVVSHHADLQRPVFIRAAANIATRQLLERAVSIICYTQTFSENSRELAPHSQKIEVLPHGVAMPPGQISSRRAADFRTDGLRLGFLGRTERWKGLDLFTDVLTADPGFSLTVAGDGSYLADFQRCIRETNLTSQVQFLGQVRGNARESFFDQIDVLVLPSINAGESFGQVLIEAQLRGIPVVASNLPTGVREICDSGRAGLLFKPGDVQELLAALRLLRNASVYERLAGSGLIRARALYSEPAVTGQIVALYRRILESNAVTV